jgi:hypothetical protein
MIKLLEQKLQSWHVVSNKAFVVKREEDDNGRIGLLCSLDTAWSQDMT